jgi:chromosome segregation ATPase
MRSDREVIEAAKQDVMMVCSDRCIERTMCPNGCDAAKLCAELDGVLSKLEAEQFAAATIKAHLDAADEREKALTSRLHQLSEDHSHCEDLLHELGARASSAENRLHSVRLFIDTPHPHWGQGEVLDGVREILDGVVENQKQFGRSVMDHPEAKAQEAADNAAARARVDALLVERPERKFTCPDDCSPMQKAPHDPSCKFA